MKRGSKLEPSSKIAWIMMVQYIEPAVGMVEQLYLTLSFFRFSMPSPSLMRRSVDNVEKRHSADSAGLDVIHPPLPPDSDHTQQTWYVMIILTI